MDRDHRARQVSRLIRTEERHDLRDILRRSISSGRPWASMMDRFERLTEGEVRNVPRGHRVNRDSPADLDLGEDASEAVASDLSDRVVERWFRKLLGSLHPDVHHATPSPPSHVRERRSDRMEHAVDLHPEDTLPGRVVNFGYVLPRIPRSTGIVH